MNLQPGHFADFFKVIWNQEPFPWQRRLAEQVHAGRWPSIIDLPTASGKTACLDIAVFTLALQASLPPEQRTASRRIVLAVNRRGIVDEAYIRARQIALQLADPGAAPVVKAVAAALRKVSGDPDAPPLDVAVLRGGIYRDNRWARSITQPTIITSTIDQVGSRLLFRGYGVSEAAQPMHAALLAHDCTLLLDEAHLTRAFQETLHAIELYRSNRWAQQPVTTPFAVVHMTATPGQTASDAFQLDKEDHKHPILRKRTSAPKPTRLCTAAKAKGRPTQWVPELATTLVEQAKQFIADGQQTVAIIVNRVATAREVHRLLGQDAAIEPHLVIGRMRPLDRDQLTESLLELVGKKRDWSTPLDKPQVVVATQCLEAGADLDFDAMVSECASLDALRQRFGRLNRAGRDIAAHGCIVIRADQVKGDDPVYSSALSATWAWLKSVAGKSDQVDLGINAMDAALAGVDLTPLLPPKEHAPVMLPAYVDAWAQTSLAPYPDPEVRLFLHGPRRGEPEVQVCWRADLPTAGQRDDWVSVVSLCPPSSPECMSIPLSAAQQWLSMRHPADAEQSDVFDALVPESADEEPRIRTALAWRGPDRSELIRSPDQVQPGDTLVLDARQGGWSILGAAPGLAYDPASGSVDDSFNPWLADIAEEARQRVTGRWSLRLDASRVKHWGDTELIRQLSSWIENTDADYAAREFKQLLADVAAALPASPADAGETDPPEPADANAAISDRSRAGAILRSLLSRFKVERHPSGGIVLHALKRSPNTSMLLPAMDDGTDSSSFTVRRQRVPLLDHLSHVSQKVTAAIELLPVQPWARALKLAAQMHDWGKADERFQAMLIRGDRTQAMFGPTLWAKSQGVSTADHRRCRHNSELPRGFRHEMLSVQLASAARASHSSSEIDDLVLHLIAAHHGYARPLAPVVIDPDPPAVSLEAIGIDVAISSEQRLAHPPHRPESGIADRYCSLAAQLGWWGLAYLEAILRLADQQASAAEDLEDLPTDQAMQEAAQ